MYAKKFKKTVLSALMAGVLCVPLLVAAPQEDERDVYFKKSRGEWWKVTRENGRLIHREVSPAPEIAAAPELDGIYTGVGEPSLYLPYQAYDVGSWPEAVAVGDVNNDGLNDVVMTTSVYNDPANDRKLFVFLQNASGTLNAPVKYALDPQGSAVSVLVGDMNSDGLNDVVVGNKGRNLEILHQNSSGTLNPGVRYNSVNTASLASADFNDDGRLDVAGIGWGNNQLSVWMQSAAGRLNSPGIYTVTHGGYDELEAGDVNSDGLPDLVIMSGQKYSCPNIAVMTKNVSSGLSGPYYYDLGGNELTRGLALGDLNTDGRNDVAVTYGGNSPSSRLGIFKQKSTRKLDLPYSVSAYDCPEPVEIGQANNDLLDDVFVAHGGWNSLSVYLQDGYGNLSPYQMFPLPYASHYNPKGMALGDINNDGETDVVLADYNNGLVVLYHNAMVPKAGVSTRISSVGEDSPSAYFVAFRDASKLNEALTVSFVLSGTAQAGIDFEPFPLTITFEPGMDMAEFFVTLVNDDVFRGDRTLILSVEDSPSYDLLTPSTTVLTITDDDYPPQ